MAISTRLGVYHELALVELVVPGSMLSLSHAFAHSVPTRACWRRAYGYHCFQRGKLGFGELRCFACSPIAVSLPWPGCGHAAKVRLLGVSLGLHCAHGAQELAVPSFPTGRQSVWIRRAWGHAQKGAGRRPTCCPRGPLNPAVPLLDSPKFCELIGPLLLNVARVEFLPPKKSRPIKHLIELTAEHLTSSWLAQQAILFPRKQRKQPGKLLLWTEFWPTWTNWLVK